ncbi:uncharacterized protein B0P05DRAFT_630098 [Gilbertella persicaria]|uniref:uncharacterized protein n=1 Tax=Gilbertella persicaria TaxID=101096 RepID=UPI00221F2379|nr:uncharacterized protein B0P05DRAFT_630098 [Gilbertella persicaria]KAI8048950.1 hypothetical protein B0P05DRAFT_630098 [Gilbertella persicaria]
MSDIPVVRFLSVCPYAGCRSHDFVTSSRLRSHLKNIHKTNFPPKPVGSRRRKANEFIAQNDPFGKVDEEYLACPSCLEYFDLDEFDGLLNHLADIHGSPSGTRQDQKPSNEDIMQKLDELIQTVKRLVV